MSHSQMVQGCTHLKPIRQTLNFNNTSLVVKKRVILSLLSPLKKCIKIERGLSINKSQLNKIQIISVLSLAIIYQNTKIIEPSIVDNNDGLFFSLLKSGLGSHFVIINVIHLKKTCCLNFYYSCYSKMTLN